MLAVRIVSLPCWDLFEKQDAAYKDSVLPPSVTARVSIEMAATLGWDRYVGPKGIMIGMHSFGASAPLKVLQEPAMLLVALPQILSLEPRLVVRHVVAGLELEAQERVAGDDETLLRQAGGQRMDAAEVRIETVKGQVEAGQPRVVALFFN